MTLSAERQPDIAEAWFPIILGPALCILRHCLDLRCIVEYNMHAMHTPAMPCY